MIRSLILMTALLAACADSSKPTPPPVQPPADAAPPAGPPVLATVHATIPGPGTGLAQPDPDLRIAVVWTASSPTEAFPRRLAQETTWTRTDATSFEISITQAPPADLLQNGLLVGRLLAYHDLNHNQQLDFTSVTDTAFTDELVAFDPDFEILYTQVGDQGTFDFGTATMPVTLYGNASPSLSCSLLDWIPRSEFEALRRSNVHDLNVGPWRYDIVYNFSAVCPDVAPPPTTTGLSCDYPATVPHLYDAGYTTQTSDFVANTCGVVMRLCERTYPLGAPVPAGWPCPCDSTKYTCGLGPLDI